MVKYLLIIFTFLGMALGHGENIYIFCTSMPLFRQARQSVHAFVRPVSVTNQVHQINKCLLIKVNPGIEALLTLFQNSNLPSV